MSILQPDKPYTFSQYFEMRIDPIDLAQYFGYRFVRSELNLGIYQGELDRLKRLSEDIQQTIPRLVRLNEQAKREALIFPVINTVSHYTNTLIRIEYPVKVTEQLQGTVDYLLSIDNMQQLVVIGAKQGDIDYGATQLVAELIAFDQWENSPSTVNQSILTGAVTIGELWRFVTLERLSKQIREDIRGYRVPDDLEPLLRRLIDIFPVDSQ